MRVESTLAIYDFRGGEVESVLTAREHYEAPNWTRDGEALVFNSEGRLYRVPVSGGEPEIIDTGDVTAINNDHGISPDGERLAFTSDGHIWTAPIEGGDPERVTDRTPSYWHGWSPDGERLAFCGERDGDYSIYTIPADGGPERRLTAGSAYDDGPDYTPDGDWIYFNSDRGGSWDVHRVPAGGGDVERVTDDERENWFPHPSPDGERIVFLSYPPGTEGHPPNREVQLRLLDPAGDHEVLHSLFGGQGTINVPSWAPDGERFAFTAYRPLD